MKFVLILLCALPVISCGKKEPAPSEPATSSFWLIQSGGNLEITFEEDWIAELPKLTAALKPLWDNLESGESSEFSAIARTYTSPSYRFFRRGGRSGLERMGKDGGVERVIEGGDLGWQDVELAVRVELIPMLGAPLGGSGLQDYHKIAEDLRAKGKKGK
jgi:hypothetical protein